MKPKFRVESSIGSVANKGDEDNMLQINEETARKMAEEAAEMAVEKALTKKKKKRDDDYEDEGGRDELGINPRSLKALENMANAFGAMKKVFSNPLQDAVENKVGGRAAEIVEKVFSPPSADQPKKDLVDQILNSQFAYGFGSGLGQRGPELVDKFTTIYGPDRTEKWLDGITAGGGRGNIGLVRGNVSGVGAGGVGGVGGAGGAGGVGGAGVGGVRGAYADTEQKQQSEMELVLSLDPNNPEHVSAYAASQGGVGIDVARKMLMIHQDDFVKQMKISRKEYTGVQGVVAQDGVGGNVSENVQEAVIENVQEYRHPVQRSQELIPVVPKDEDNRWDDKHERIVSPDELQLQGKQISGQVDASEITGYLKQLNDYVVGLKDMVEKQNNEIFNLRGELDILKGAERVIVSPEKVDNIKDVSMDNISKDVMTGDVVPDDVRTGDVVPDDVRTRVRSIKTIKKGFSYVKADKEE